MGNRMTARGIVRGSKTIEIQDENLDDWVDQEVILTIKRKKNLSAAEQMLAEMKKGGDIGYEKIDRSGLYRV